MKHVGHFNCLVVCFVQLKNPNFNAANFSEKVGIVGRLASPNVGKTSSLFIFADIVVKHSIPRKWWQI